MNVPEWCHLFICFGLQMMRRAEEASKLQRHILGREEITDFIIDGKDRFRYSKDKTLDYELEEENRGDWESRRR